MRNANDLHTALMLFSASAYIQDEIKNGNTNDELHHKIVSGIEAYKTFRRFSAEELKLIQDIQKDEAMSRITKTEICFVCYALSILKLLSEDESKRDVIIGVSKKKLRMGDSVFVIPMLKEKRRDIERYERLKKIIEESRVNAKLFYSYTKTMLDKAI